MLTERELDVLLRRARGESQSHIAKALKISQAAVSQFETNGQRKLIAATNTLEFLQNTAITIEDSSLGKKVTYKGGKK